MKRIVAMVLSAALIFVLSGCQGENASTSNSDLHNGNSQISSGESDNVPSLSTDTTAGKVLIAYFTRVGNTDFPDDVDAISSASLNLRNGTLAGNTELIAAMIQQETGGELFRIQTEKKYPVDYNALVDYGQEEPDEDSRPVLQSHVENMEEYDVIFLGYPNWWFNMPMAVYSFLEEYNLSGKTIIPFCTHGGSRFSDTISKLEEILPDSTILEGFEVHGERAADAEDDVAAWIDKLGIATK